MNNCAVCGKISDAAKEVVVGEEQTKITFCGTDYDAWLRSPEKKRADETGRLVLNLSDFVDRQGAERRNKSGRPIPSTEVLATSEVHIIPGKESPP